MLVANQPIQFVKISSKVPYSRTHRSCWESVQPAGTDFSQNFRPYIFLKLPCNPHSHTSSPMQCLFFIDHGVHPHNAYSPLVMQSLFSGSHFVDFIYGWMYLSTTSARFVTGQGNILQFDYFLISSKFKVIKGDELLQILSFLKANIQKLLFYISAKTFRANINV